MSELATPTEVAPFVYVYENVIDNCQEIINLAAEHGWEFASISVTHNDYYRGGGPDDIKNARFINIVPTVKVDPKWFWMLRTIWQHAEQYGEESGATFNWVEAIQVFEFKAGDDEHVPHYDSHGHDKRVLSAVLFLNDVDEGGELVFPKFGTVIKPRAGRLVIFPSNFAWRHDSLPPISNDKYVAATWVSE